MTIAKGFEPITNSERVITLVALSEFAKTKRGKIFEQQITALTQKLKEQAPSKTDASTG